MSKAPAPTPAVETSAASTGTNISTAIANAFLTNMKESGPDGSKTFDQTGSTSITDPYTGKTYEIPRFSVNTTLSPQQAAIKEQQDAASLNLANLGNNLSGTLGQQLTGNFTIGNSASIRCLRSATRTCGRALPTKASRLGLRPMTGKWPWLGSSKTTLTTTCF
jgi:hypothetical protein